MPFKREFLGYDRGQVDAAIAKLAQDPDCEDDLAIKRLKKRKLRIKDMVAYLENQLIPDLDA